MIIDESAYLEHFGRKGMKWGVRKVDSSESRVPKHTGRNVALKVGIGAAAVAAGALFAGKYMSGDGHVSVSSVGGQRTKDGSFIVKSMLRQLKEKRLSDLPSARTLKYSHGHEITKLVENILDMTR